MIALLLLLLGLPAQQTVVVDANSFHGCSVTGDGKSKAIEEADRLKNRSGVPTSPVPFNLGALLSGQKLDPATAVVVRARVTKVKPGGQESVNCHAKGVDLRDTHIEVVVYDGPQQKHPIIVEVTPRWREAMKAVGVDWSTATLKKTLTGHVVEFTGWPFYDGEHANASDDTHPGGRHNWRATPWELHPVTSIRVIQ